MKHLITLVVIFISIIAYSQTDQKAKLILDKVSETTKTYKSITANFEFIMQNTEVGLNETNEGSLIIQGEKYKLSINGVEIFSNGTSQWTYIKDAEEVTISETGNDEEGSINPATIFSIYEEGYKYTYLGEFTTSNIKTYKIDLIPIEVKDFSRVILEIGQNDSKIKSATMYGTDENLYIINVKSMDTSISYDASTFVFDENKHPNIDLIDMR